MPEPGDARERRRFPGVADGYKGIVLLLLFVPGTALLLAAILWLSDLCEKRFLSPRSLIIGVVKTRGSTPEYAEEFVARQFERLLAEQQHR